MPDGRPKVTVDKDGVIRVDGVVFTAHRLPPTERLGKWLISKAGKSLLRLQKYPKALGRIIAYGLPLVGLAGTAFGLPPATLTAVTTGARVLVQILSGEPPTCE